MTHGLKFFRILIGQDLILTQDYEFNREIQCSLLTAPERTRSRSKLPESSRSLPRTRPGWFGLGSFRGSSLVGLFGPLDLPVLLFGTFLTDFTGAATSFESFLEASLSSCRLSSFKYCLSYFSNLITSMSAANSSSPRRIFRTR